MRASAASERMLQAWLRTPTRKPRSPRAHFRSSRRMAFRSSVLRDGRARGIADGDRARVVHAAPDAGVVPVGARLRSAGVGPARLAHRRQRERLAVIEVAQEHGGGGAVETGMPGRVFRVRRRGEERQPVGIGHGVGVAIGLRQGNRRDGTPGHFRCHGPIEALGGPDGDGGIGHRDVQRREEPGALRRRQMPLLRHLARRLVLMDAGTPFPEGREQRVLFPRRESSCAVGRPSDSLPAEDSIRLRVARECAPLWPSRDLPRR